MKKLKVKVSHVDVVNNTIFLKFGYDTNPRPIDEYNEVGFQIIIGNDPAYYVDDFITGRLPELCAYADVRDACDEHIKNVDYDSWVGHEKEYTTPELDPYGPDHLAPGLRQAEVEL